MQVVEFLIAIGLAALAAFAGDVPLLRQPEAAWLLSPICVAGAAWTWRTHPGVAVALLALSAQPWILRTVAVRA